MGARTPAFATPKLQAQPVPANEKTRVLQKKAAVCGKTRGDKSAVVGFSHNQSPAEALGSSSGHDAGPRARHLCVRSFSHQCRSVRSYEEPDDCREFYVSFGVEAEWSQCVVLLVTSREWRCKPRP